MLTPFKFQIIAMKRNSTPRLFFAVSVMGLLLYSCSASQTASSATDSGNNTSTKTITTAESNSGLTLVNYLRRVPGIQISQRGSDISVMIRGASSIGSNNQPLFVLNGSGIGNSYAEAVTAVDVNDIKSVNVVQGTEGQQTYGMRGANGVIQIFTKSGVKSKK